MRKRSKIRVEVERIDVGDPQAVGHEAAGRRSAAGSDRNPLLARVADEVPHDQEVPRVLHLLDHVDLVREPALVLVDRVTQHACRCQMLQPRQPLAKPFAGHVLEVAVERKPGRHIEVRQVILSLRQDDVAALGDANGVRERLREVLERLGHLLRRLQEELLRVVPQPLRIAERLAGADAQQDVVRVRVARAQVVHVVGADERQARGLARSPAGPALTTRCSSMPCHCISRKKLPGPRMSRYAAGRLDRFLLLLVRQPFGHLALQAAAQPDQPLACCASSSLSMRGL